MYFFSNYFLHICYSMSRMPKLSMEIESVEEQGLAVDSYLQKPALPSSKEKPAKKKRVMTEKQLSSLAKAREKSALNRRLKKEQKVADKLALKEEKKKGKKKIIKAYAEPLPTIEEEEYPEEQYEEGSDMEVITSEDQYSDYPNAGDNGIDYEFIMSNVYGMLKEDATREQEAIITRKKEEEEYMLKKNAYDDTIRADERARLKGVVEEKQKHKKTIAPMTNGTEWDSCFQPRGRGVGDIFF